MGTRVCFLRAINVGTRRLPMATVRSALEAAGYCGLDTHLATGNVRLDAPEERPLPAVRDHVAAVLAEAAGFDVPVVVLTDGDLRAVHAEAHALDDGPAGAADKRSVAFLPAPPGPEARAELATWASRHPPEGAHVGAQHLHWWTDGRTTDAVIFRPATLARLGIPGATSRTLAVVDTLVRTWC